MFSSLTWETGRRLTAATTTDGTNLTFTYDMDGLRLTKTVGSTEHKYIWQGDRLVSESWGSNTLEFFYDGSGNPYAFDYNGEVYYYVTNLQGDIVRIVDASGASIAEYAYDAWGKLITDEPTSGSVGNINPLRYRGYYYDTQSKLYYLQSRYYDPEVRRFINADEFASTGQGFVGCNMFAYCLNNPVNYIDSGGDNPIILFEVAVAVIAFLVITIFAMTPEGEALSKSIVERIYKELELVQEAIASVPANVQEKIDAINKKHPGTYYVYTLIDSTGTVRYVGRTNDLVRRLKEHKQNPRLENYSFGEAIGGLNYTEARVLEEVLMVTHHTINGAGNLIHGISQKNPNLVYYMQSFDEFIFNAALNTYYSFAEPF